MEIIICKISNIQREGYYIRFSETTNPTCSHREDTGKRRIRGNRDQWLHKTKGLILYRCCEAILTALLCPWVDLGFVNGILFHPHPYSLKKYKSSPA